MKGRILTAVAVMALGAALAAQTTLSPEALLKAAINREVVDGDVAGAIQQYKDIASKHANNHAVAAGALLRLGGLYEKQGNAEATPTYQRIVNEFADAGAPFTAARARLAALQQPSFPFRIRDIASPCGAGVLVLNWSPDGKYVAYATRGRDGLRMCHAATGKAVSLGLRPGEGIEDFEWAPNSQSVVLAVSTSPDQLEFRIVSLAGGEARVVASSPSRSDSSFAFSPDSRKLAFLSGAAGADASGPKVHVVTLSPKPSPAVNLGPLSTASGRILWAPDGSQVAFVAPAAGKSAAPISVVDVNTQRSHTIQTPAPPAPNSQIALIAWTGANRIVFGQSVASGSDDYWVDAAGGTPQRICEGRGGFGGDGCQGLSPDGTLKIIRQNVSGGGRIALRNIVTREERTLTNEAVIEQTISYNGPAGTTGSFSPDGKLFVFFSNRDGKRGLYVVPVDKTPVANPLKIANLHDGNLAGLWIGNDVVFSVSESPRNIFRMDLDPQTGQPSGRPIRLTQDTPSNIQPGISPDGRQIAYTSRAGVSRGFMLMDANGQRERLAHEVPPDRLLRMMLVGWRSNEELLVSDLGDAPLAPQGYAPTLMVLNLATHDFRPAGTPPPDRPARVFDKAPVLKDPPPGVTFEWNTARKSPDGSFIVLVGTETPQTTWQRIENITYDAVVKLMGGRK